MATIRFATRQMQRFGAVQILIAFGRFISLLLFVGMTIGMLEDKQGVERKLQKKRESKEGDRRPAFWQI